MGTLRFWVKVTQIFQAWGGGSSSALLTLHSRTFQRKGLCPPDITDYRRQLGMTFGDLGTQLAGFTQPKCSVQTTQHLETDTPAPAPHSHLSCDFLFSLKKAATPGGHAAGLASSSAPPLPATLSARGLPPGLAPLARSSGFVVGFCASRFVRLRAPFRAGPALPPPRAPPSLAPSVPALDFIH